MTVRAVLIALCGLMLTACNMVVSHEPLFTKADEAGAAPLKDGWWVAPSTADGPCAFDADIDARDWPGCADAQLIVDGRMIDTDKGGEPQALILAGGDPRILQAGIKERGPNLYAYAAMRETAKDKDGRVVGFTTWLVECGPPPPPPEPKDAKGPADYATRRPVAGLKVDEETGNCWTTDPALVRRAAMASESWTKEKKTIRWVRAARRGEEKARPKPAEPEAAGSPAADDPDKMR